VTWIFFINILQHHVVFSVLMDFIIKYRISLMCSRSRSREPKIQYNLLRVKPFMRMTSMSIHPSIHPAPVTLERFNSFEMCFRYSTEGVICRFKFVFWRNRTVPSRSTVKGHIRFKYITPHVTYRWKGLVKSFPTIYNLWTLWPLYDLQGRFWGQSSPPSCEVSLERSCQELSNDA
jgi:hypothetical protein